MVLENSIETHLVNRIKQLGGFTLKGDTPGRRFLDRICILPRGRTVYVELKKPRGGVYSAHQIETMKRLTKLGHEVAGLHTKEEIDEYFLG